MNQRDLETLRLYHQGLSPSQVGQALGVTESRILWLLHGYEALSPEDAERWMERSRQHSGSISEATDQVISTPAIEVPSIVSAILADAEEVTRVETTFGIGRGAAAHLLRQFGTCESLFAAEQAEQQQKLAEEQEAAARREETRIRIEKERNRRDKERAAFERLSPYEQARVSNSPVCVVSGRNEWIYDTINEAEKELRTRERYQQRHGYITPQTQSDNPPPIAEFRNGRIIETNQAGLPLTSKHPEDVTWSDRTDWVKPVVFLVGGLLLCLGWLLLEQLLNIGCVEGMPPSLGGC